MIRLHRSSSAAILLLVVSLSAQAAWFDAAWPFRREVNVAWEAEKAQGSELALVEVLTAGHQKPDGSDVRVATDEGRVVFSKVLESGPGDRVRLVFAMARGQRKYHVYFGHPNPPPKPKGADDHVFQAGLFMEMRMWPGGAVDNADQMIAAWSRAKTPIGNTVVPALFVGRNPFGEQQQWISRFTGTLFAPLPGEYAFAISADDKGLFCLDGKPVVFAPNLTGDVRYQAKVTLGRGPHDVTAYHVNLGAEGMISLVWTRPDAPKFELVRENFGSRLLYRATPAQLEEIRKPFTADFKVEYLGESLYAGHYSNRYRFTANAPKTLPPKYSWDLGDGQTSEGNVVEHVYLADGVYPIKLTARIATNVDAQTTNFAARRDYDADRTQIDEPAVQSLVVQSYALEKLPPAHLPWAVLLHQRAKKPDLMLAAAAALAREKSHADPTAAMLALTDATHEALAVGRIAQMVKVWDSVPADSNLQPTAATTLAQLLVWRTADFDRACTILAPQVAKAKDSALTRLYGQALVLNQKPAEGRKVLEALPMEGPADRKAAISGASARTVEYYIGQSDPETGEDAWDKWQRKYPAEFLEGYGVLLRVKLMELRKTPEAAARVAEAFAQAVPQSSYSPGLLDQASKLLATINPTKSADLRKTLKQKYPENPLSQDK